MKGDFTRDTFKPEQHYQQVLQQQGRVQLDADWNEQAALAARRDETTTADLVGDCGGPADGAAFGITPVAGGDFQLAAGRYYVDGIQCELEAPCLFSQQPDHREGTALTPGDYLIYLDVWQRHLTVHEHEELREAALGGPDTATRVQTVWQVRAARLDLALNPASACGQAASGFAQRQRPALPQLAAQTKAATFSTDPCLLPATAGYRGLENQLYRIEIHTPGALGAATWKWSRENGSVVTRILSSVLVPVAGANVNRLTVASTGADANLGFQPDDWVEILHATDELEGTPGTLAQVATVDDSAGIITLKQLGTHPMPVTITLTDQPRLRRWDGLGGVTANLAVNNGFLALEQGLEVRFSQPAGAEFRPGDYWLIPARAAAPDAEAGKIEWPRTGSTPDARTPRGIRHHYCRLGVITVAAGSVTPVSDCRCLWPALTSVPRLFYVSGDGQEVMPDLTQPAQFFKLPQPLLVGVANAQCLKTPLTVRFTVTGGGGGRVAATGMVPTVQTVAVPTDATGLASCDFFLAAAPPSQQVTARLLDAGGNEVSLPVSFNANLSIASQVAYRPGECDLLKPARDVQAALDLLCAATGQGEGCEVAVSPTERLDEVVKRLLAKKQYDLRLCLMAGDHSLPGGWSLDAAKLGEAVNLTITGGGLATRLAIAGRPVVLANLNSFVLRDVDVALADGLTLALIQCGHVEVRGCHFTGVTEKSPLLLINEAGRQTIHGNTLEATARSTESTPALVFPADFLAQLYRRSDRREFAALLPVTAQKLAALGPAEKQDFAGRTTTLVRQLSARLSQAEAASYARLLRAVAVEQPEVRVVIERLREIRTAALAAAPGLALGLGGHGADATITDNDIRGIVSLHGIPGGLTLTPEELKQLSRLANQGLFNNSEASGVLQMHTNRLSRVTLGDAMIQTIKDALRSTGGASVPGILTAAFVSRNVFELGGSLFLAKTAAFTTNRFEEVRTDAGSVFTDTAIYVGNAAGNDVRLFNFSRGFQLTANLVLNIVDS